MEQPPKLAVEDRFAIVPEWLLDTDISHAAVRLHAVLLRYGQSSSARMPSRSTSALRMHKKSTDTIDRALNVLVGIGAVAVEHRYEGAQRLTNAYHVRTARPGRVRPPTPMERGSHSIAATPRERAGRSRTDGAGVAADSGHNPEHLTQSTSSTGAERNAKHPAAEEEVAVACGIEDWLGFLSHVQKFRRDIGASVTRWSGPCLATALQLAVRGRDWPTNQAADALRRVAADPGSKSPMRVAEAGPWWDEPPRNVVDDEGANGIDLRDMERALLEAGGVRIELQMQVRRALEEAGVRVTRAAVILSTNRLLLDRQTKSVPSLAPAGPPDDDVA